MDGTPIYDIKPYLAYVDSHPEASGGFTDQIQDHKLKVDFPAGLLEQVPKEKRAALLAVLANDPRQAIRRILTGSTECPLEIRTFILRWMESFCG